MSPASGIHRRSNDPGMNEARVPEKVAVDRSNQSNISSHEDFP